MAAYTVVGVCRQITQLSNKMKLERSHLLHDRLHYGIHGKPQTAKRIAQREAKLEQLGAEMAALRVQLGAMLDELQDSRKLR